MKKWVDDISEVASRVSGELTSIRDLGKTTVEGMHNLTPSDLIDLDKKIFGSVFGIVKEEVDEPQNTKQKNYFN